MGSLVRLQMGAFCVDLFAAQKLTLVYSTLGVRIVVAVVEAHVMIFGRSCKWR